jgi:hypothetical protein
MRAEVLVQLEVPALVEQKQVVGAEAGLRLRLAGLKRLRHASDSTGASREYKTGASS